MKGFVDKGICIGCSVCTSICPEAFEMDDDGLARANDIELIAGLEDMAEEAEASCPVNAISLK